MVNVWQGVPVLVTGGASFISSHLVDRLVGLGARVRVAPNHACLAAAAHDRYHVVDGGERVLAVWDRVNGW